MVKKLLISLLLCVNLFAGEANSQIQNLITKAFSGDANAQNSLGGIYNNGEIIEKSNEDAFYWYQMAAKNGHMNGQFMSGIYYAYGYGIKRDSEKAKYWLEKAAKNGHPKAIEILNDSNFFTLLEKNFSDKLYDETVIDYIKQYDKNAKNIKVTYKENDKKFNEVIAYFTYPDNKSNQILYGKLTFKKNNINYWYTTHFKTSSNKNDL